MSKNKFLFFHIPHTCGEVINDWISDNLISINMDIDLDGDLEEISSYCEYWFDEYDWISGGFGYDRELVRHIRSTIDHNLYVLTMLCCPTTHVLEKYNNLEGVCDPESFFEKNISPRFNNPFCRYLTGDNIKNLLELDGNISTVVDQERSDKAFDNLQHFDYIGCLERGEALIDQLSNDFPEIEEPEERILFYYNYDKPESIDVFENIINMTEYDRRIWIAARKFNGFRDRTNERRS